MFANTYTNLCLFRDCFFGSKFSIFDSPKFAAFHEKLMARSPELPEVPLQEIDAKDATRELVEKLYSKAPLVIRNALKDSTSVKCWHDSDWWMGGYAKEKVLCTSPTTSGGFSLDEFIGSNLSLYVQGATALFERRPELKDMVESDVTRMVAPGEVGKRPLFYQLFMGWKNQGSTVHCAIGLNVFRQISGRKKWYFMPPSETPKVFPKLYENGFSATSKTVQHHAQGKGAPYFGKIKRFSTILNPGDVLIVPPWWWHAVENVAADKELVIGVATRYEAGRLAMRMDPFKTLIAIVKAKAAFAKRGADSGDDYTSLQTALAFEEKLMDNRNGTYQQLTLHAESGAEQTAA